MAVDSRRRSAPPAPPCANSGAGRGPARICRRWYGSSGFSNKDCCPGNKAGRRARAGRAPKRSRSRLWSCSRMRPSARAAWRRPACRKRCRSRNCRLHESAVVERVVAREEVGHRRLRRHGLEGGMSVDHAGRRVETGVRNSPDADLAVVARQVLDQPIDGVRDVRAFVDLLWSAWQRPLRGGLDEDAFGKKAAAYVLVESTRARRNRGDFRHAGSIGRPAKRSTRS